MLKIKNKNHRAKKRIDCDLFSSKDVTLKLQTSGYEAVETLTPETGISGDIREQNFQ